MRDSTVHPTLRRGFLTAFATAAAISLLVLVGHPARSAEPVRGDLVKVGIRQDGSLTSVVGEFLRKESDGVTVRSLKSGEEMKIASEEIQIPVAPINRDEAIRGAGLPAFLAWQMNRVLLSDVEGKVAELTPGFVLITLGKAQNITTDSRLAVYRMGNDLRDPDTGEVLAVRRPKVARLQVVEVQDRYSKAKLLDNLDADVRVGDRVTLEEGRRLIAILPLRDAKGNETSAGVRFAEQLITELVRRKIDVVERAQMDRVIAELGWQQTDLVDAGSAQKLGKQLGAYALLTGSLTFNGAYMEANVRLLESATGRVLAAESCRVAGTGGGSVPAGRSASVTGSVGEKINSQYVGRWRLLDSGPADRRGADKKPGSAPVYEFRPDGALVITTEAGGREAQWSATGQIIRWVFDDGSEGRFHVFENFNGELKGTLNSTAGRRLKLIERVE